ncbi:hypothetical protein D7S91_38225 [Burkholderia contaminans]|uniref:Uncharacterized protein n=1 Tax=Burkholderia contaminans TaxID=488447 RepID=A0A250LLG3_9BURK|nr:hypothetical protein [Burkholderia contaminans]MBA9842746.1 hypothetical protein [Burkholderia contaminans]MBA9867511.1 hypothetical protein [Burkholderia contaminans]MBA9910147.1 hypothetical protein [Burkholderia contaminans]MBA9934352.1 hypothetical protein [Burkholderia contaminans]
MKLALRAFGGFATEVIDGRPDRFERIEIEGVRDVGDCCEVDSTSPEYFSVYLRYGAHSDDVGAQCVGDFESHAEAGEYAISLAREYDWKIHDRAQVAG